MVHDLYDAESLVLKEWLKSLSMPILLTNSLIRSKPASEDKSPPSKFILICLLLSSDKVFTILIKCSFVVIVKTLNNLILPQMDVLFLFT